MEILGKQPIITDVTYSALPRSREARVNDMRGRQSDSPTVFK